MSARASESGDFRDVNILDKIYQFKNVALCRRTTHDDDFIFKITASNSLHNSYNNYHNWSITKITKRHQLYELSNKYISFVYFRSNIIRLVDDTIFY